MSKHQKNVFVRYLLNTRYLIFVLSVAAVTSACQTTSTGSPSSPSGSSQPSIPSGGSSSGSPSEDSTTSPSQSSQGEAQDSDSQSSSNDNQGSAETSPDWEEEIQTDTGSQQDDGVTFEEPDTRGEPSFEEPAFDQPAFEDGGGLTEQELEELEKELNESLGDFDETIQREKTFAEERANDNIDDGALGGIGVFETYQEDQTSSNSNKANESDQESAQSNDSSSTSENAGTASGDQQSQSEGIGNEREESAQVAVEIPDDITSDDIVARQIREAAENESDPELRRKLWDEYRKYKNQ